jgi:putative transposase
MKQDCIQGKFIHLPKIGAVKLIQHRPLPEGFIIKTATLTRKADGWDVTLSLQDASVPAFTPDLPTLENTIGIDMGLDSFLVTDEGESIPVPQYYRKAQKRLKRLQRSLSRKKKGSKRYKKAQKQLQSFQRFWGMGELSIHRWKGFELYPVINKKTVSKAHLKIANQRRDFHYKTANKIVRKGKHIAHEALNITSIARSRLAKSTYVLGGDSFWKSSQSRLEELG